MSDDAPSPENNAVLRQLQGMRRENAEIMEREARMIELVHRMASRVEEGIDRMAADMAALRRDVSGLRSDLVLMENRVLTAITEVRQIAGRLDDREHA